jgi:hypothetical protein
LRAGEEEPHRGGASERLEIRQSVEVRKCERGQSILAFTTDLQRRATGGEDTKRRARGEEMIGEDGAGVDEVLAVVEDE